MTTEYWHNREYKPKYFLGDRVFGYWNKIPFVGSVGNDTIVSEIEGPRITVIVDLPIKHNNKIFHLVTVKHKDIKLLKNLDLEQQKTKAK